MLPNLITIGAMKCGTTSLHYYLNLHPQISMSKIKELDFFVEKFNWSKGVEWYKSNFTGKAQIYGESSHNYTCYPFFDGVPERIYSVVPEAKLIYILRDPIKRIFSEYMQNYSDGRESRQIEDALKNFDSPYIYRSKYYMQLEQYLKYFPKNNILIITQEDLYNNRQPTLQKIFRFLNVDDSFYCEEFSNMVNKSSIKRRKNRIGSLLAQLNQTDIVKRFPCELREKIGKIILFPFSKKIDLPQVSENLRQELIDNIKDDTNRLRQYTGRDFKDWCL